MKKYRLAAYLTAATVLFTGCTSDTVSSSTEQNGGANVAEGQTNKAVTDMNNTTVTNEHSQKNSPLFHRNIFPTQMSRVLLWSLNMTLMSL